MIVDIMRAKLTEHNMADGSSVISSNEMSYAGEEDPETATTVQIFRNF
jgi:predicted aconitase with swiveling domain